MKHLNNYLRKVAFIIIFISIKLISPAQTSSFYIYFVQNDRRINISEEKIVLKKEPFRIYLEYTKPIDVIVSASDKPSAYNAAMKGKLLDQIPGLQCSVEIEPFFLNKNTVNLTSEQPYLWRKNSTHGEIGFKNSEGRFVCYREIDRLYLMNENKIYNVNDINNNIFFVFIYAEKEDNDDFLEIQREMVKIKWVEFYEDETKSYERKKKATGKEKIRIAKQELKQKQRMEKKEKKAIEKLEKKKKKAIERKLKKEKKRDEKEKKKLEEEIKGN